MVISISDERIDGLVCVQTPALDVYDNDDHACGRGLVGQLSVGVKKKFCEEILLNTYFSFQVKWCSVTVFQNTTDDWNFLLD